MIENDSSSSDEIVELPDSSNLSLEQLLLQNEFKVSSRNSDSLESEETTREINKSNMSDLQ